LATIASARKAGFLTGYILTEQASEASLVLCLAGGEPKQFSATTLALVLEQAEHCLLLMVKLQTPEAMAAWRVMQETAQPLPTWCECDAPEASNNPCSPGTCPTVRNRRAPVLPVADNPFVSALPIVQPVAVRGDLAQWSPPPKAKQRPPGWPADAPWPDAEYIGRLAADYAEELSR
jgi:hypothetical protein